MGLYGKWIETDLPKDTMASTKNKANKRTRINTTKRKPKMDKWGIYRENNRSYIANIVNKKQPNI